MSMSSVASVSVPPSAPFERSGGLTGSRSQFATSTSSTASSQGAEIVSLPLYENKVTAFIGPSGCGKSTLLRVLNRMYDLYPHQRATGEVMLDGENILSPRRRPRSAARRASAWCSRSRRRFRCRSTTTSPSASGCTRRCRSRSSTAASKRRCDARRCGTRSRTSSSESGLSLSGGQQQRLCIARTVAVAA